MEDAVHFRASLALAAVTVAPAPAVTVHSSKTKQRDSRSFVSSETWAFPGHDRSLEAEPAMAGAVVGVAFGLR